jgi:hypothetical protein
VLPVSAGGDDEVCGDDQQRRLVTKLPGLDRVVEHTAVLGNPSSWAVMDVQDDLVLAMIDAVWSIGVRAGGVANVLARYRALRGERRHTFAELVAFMDALGGPEAFADAVKNRQRTSTTNGILKAEAVYRQAAMLAEEGVQAVTDLTDHVRERWLEVPGSRSGTSWDAFRLVTGHDTVKADRMLRRFCAAALGTTESRVSAKRAHTLVVAAAAELGVSARALDGAIWTHESARALDRSTRG